MAIGYVETYAERTVQVEGVHRPSAQLPGLSRMETVTHYCAEAWRLYLIWTAIIDPDCLGERLSEIVIPDGWTAARARREWRKHKEMCEECNDEQT